MKSIPKPLLTAVKYALILLLYIASFLLWKNQYTFTQHKWHEGFSNKVIYDVMENQAAPDTPVTDVIANLGEGTPTTPETREAYLTLCEYDPATHDVLTYTVKPNRKENIPRTFVIIHDNKTVQKTMLINSLTE